MGAIAEMIQAVALLAPGGGQVIEEILFVDWKIRSFVLCFECVKHRVYRGERKRNNNKLM